MRREISFGGTQLRSEMTFEATQRHTREKLQFVQTVTSLDDLDVVRRRKERRRGPAPSSDFHHQFDSTTLLQHVVGNILAPGETGQNEEVLYYDSDPECSRVHTTGRGPRRVQAERANKIEHATRNRRRSLSGIPINRLVNGRRWKKLDDGLVAEIIEVRAGGFFVSLS